MTASKAPVPVFPTPGQAYDPLNESQFRQAVERFMQEVAAYPASLSGLVEHADTHEAGGDDEVDHGALVGLTDDDHTQYYNATRHTKAVHDALGLDHGALSGKDDDDHTQYYNAARHTKAVHDSLGLDHGALSGKDDDDHLQYLLKDGTRSLTGAWNANNKVTVTEFVVGTDPGGSELVRIGTKVLIGTDPGGAQALRVTGGIRAEGDVIIGYNDTATIFLDGIDGSLTASQIGLYEAAGTLWLHSRGSVGVDVDTDNNASGGFSVRKGMATTLFTVANDNNVTVNQGALIIGTDPGGSEKVRVAGDVRVETAAPNFVLKSSSDTNTEVYGNANRTAAGASILQLIAEWNGDSVAAINLTTGYDTTNKDDGQIKFLTQPDSATGLQARGWVANDGSLIWGSDPGGSELVRIYGSLRIRGDFASGGADLNYITGAGYDHIFKISTATILALEPTQLVAYYTLNMQTADIYLDTGYALRDESTLYHAYLPRPAASYALLRSAEHFVVQIDADSSGSSAVFEVRHDATTHTGGTQLFAVHEGSGIKWGGGAYIASSSGLAVYNGTPTTNYLQKYDGTGLADSRISDTGEGSIVMAASISIGGNSEVQTSSGPLTLDAAGGWVKMGDGNYLWLRTDFESVTALLLDGPDATAGDPYQYSANFVLQGHYWTGSADAELQFYMRVGVTGSNAGWLGISPYGSTSLRIYQDGKISIGTDPGSSELLRVGGSWRSTDSGYIYPATGSKSLVFRCDDGGTYIPLGEIQASWAGTTVVKIRLRGTADDVNKDEGDILIQTAEPGGTLKNAVRITQNQVMFVYGQYIDLQNAANPFVKVSETTNTVQALLQAQSTLVKVGAQTNHPLHLIVNNLAKAVLDTDGSFILGTDPTGSYLLRVGGSGYFKDAAATLKVEATGADAVAQLVLQGGPAGTNEGIPKIVMLGRSDLCAFESDDSENAYYCFYSKFGSTRTYDAAIRIFGSATSSWGTYLQLFHTGANGVIQTDVGDINLLAAGGDVYLTPSGVTAARVAGVVYSTSDPSGSYPTGTIWVKYTA